MRNVLRARILMGPWKGAFGEGQARRILSVILKIIFYVVVLSCLMYQVAQTL
jgi:hypothetical protein